MKLNDGQISEIESFVKSKYVEYYDIQVELVDHLASSVEHEMALNSKLDFKKALTTCYQNFGIFGFLDFVVEREKAVYLQSRKKYWNTFFDFFKLPRFVYTGLFFIVNLLILNLLEPQDYIYFIFPLISILFLLGINSQYYMNKEMKLKLVQKKYQPLVISFCGSFINIFNILMKEGLKTKFYSNPILLAVFITLLFIGVWAELNTHQQIHEKLRLDYPEAFK